MDKLSHILELVQESDGVVSTSDDEDDEIELDMDALSIPVLRELQKYVAKTMKELNSNKHSPSVIVHRDLSPMLHNEANHFSSRTPKRLPPVPEYDHESSEYDSSDDESGSNVTSASTSASSTPSMSAMSSMLTSSSMVSSSHGSSFHDIGNMHMDVEDASCWSMLQDPED